MWEIKIKNMRNEKTQEAKNCDEDPCKQQRWERQRQADEEESDEEHHNPDTLERQLEEFMGEIENAPLITMGKEEGKRKERRGIQDPELDNRPRSRPLSRHGRERLRPADEQNRNKETHTPDMIERQEENSKTTMWIKKTLQRKQF